MKNDRQKLQVLLPFEKQLKECKETQDGLATLQKEMEAIRPLLRKTENLENKVASLERDLRTERKDLHA
ncbi:hypothetical protein V8E54_004116 [Elaphomyces granulatus]